MIFSFFRCFKSILVLNFKLEFFFIYIFICQKQTNLSQKIESKKGEKKNYPGNHLKVNLFRELFRCWERIFFSFSLSFNFSHILTISAALLFSIGFTILNLFKTFTIFIAYLFEGSLLSLKANKKQICLSSIIFEGEVFYTFDLLY